MNPTDKAIIIFMGLWSVCFLFAYLPGFPPDADEVTTADFGTTTEGEDYDANF